MSENNTLSPMQPAALLRLRELSTTEIMAGVMLFLQERKKFPEQALYELFREIGQRDQDLNRRFRVIGRPPAELRSEPLRRVLDHMEIGKIVDVPLPNPVDQFYSLRTVQKDAVEDDLKERGVLPAHEEELRILSNRFSQIIDKVAEQLKAEQRA